MKNNLLLSIGLWILAGSCLPVSAQNGRAAFTGFSFSPDALEVNPGILPDFKFHLALPQIQTTVSNSFSLQELFVPEGDSVKLSLNKFNSSKSGPLQVMLEERIRLLSLGFNLQSNTYLYLGASVHADVGTALPAGLFRFVNQGGELNFDGFNLQASSYIDKHVGLIHQMGPYTFGAKFRLINGLYNLNTRNNDLRLISNPNEISLEADLHLQSSNLQQNNDKGLPSGEFPGIQEVLGNNQNKGQALDLGITYQVDKFQSVGLSVLNLIGFIEWTQNISEFKLSGNYDYPVPVFELNAEDNPSDLFSGLEDTLGKVFTFDTLINPSGYRTRFPLQLIGHYKYQLSSKFSAGGILSITPGRSAQIMHKPSLTGYVQTDIRRLMSMRLQLHASTQRIAFGTMFSLRLLGLQFCMGVDNFRQFYSQSSTKLFQVNAGVSVCFGSRNSKRLLF